MTDTSTPYLPIDRDILMDRFWKTDTDYVTIAEVARMERTTPTSVYTRAQRRGLIHRTGMRACILRSDIHLLTQLPQPWRSVKPIDTPHSE